jgi:ABC-type multidrug transport system ATPase subunit
MIRIVDVWQHYGFRHVLRAINLEIQPGESLCVMGPNGMGKSTLLSVAAGLHTPARGHVEIAGRRRQASLDDERIIRRQVAYLSDSPWLPINNTGTEFLYAVGRLYGVDDARLAEHIDRLTALFNLQEIISSPIRSYSSGQRKKLGLSAALATDAPVLILDEPFSGGLDSSALLALHQVLRHLAQQGRTLLVAVPVPELVEGMATRIAIIQDGQILACDTAAGLRSKSGVQGSLGEVLEAMVNPQGTDHIRTYLEAEKR